jgi:hypothetical protein
VSLDTFRTTDEVVLWLSQKGLRVRPQTLINWRHVGGGPPFHRFGHRVVYAESALVEWVRQRLGDPLQSTSDHSASREKSSALRRGRAAAIRRPASVVGSTSRAASTAGATVGTRP